MRKSAGLAIICNKKILLVHPTNATWKFRHSIPKGEINKGESKLTAAMRETWEEIGLMFLKNQIDIDNEYKCVYKTKAGKTYKKVYYYVVEIDKEPEIKKEMLQQEEVDDARFYTYDEAKEIILSKQLSILEQLRNDSYI